jgi:hypothetical protein
MTAAALWFGLAVGAIVFALTVLGFGAMRLWRRRRARHTFLRSRDGSIVQLYGPYKTKGRR